MQNKITYTEQELIALLKSKNEVAFNYLYTNYSAALYGVALKATMQVEMANDILQETFVKIWNNIEKYDAEKGKLFAWLVSIARNTAIDYLRSKEHNNNQNTDDLPDDIEQRPSLHTFNPVEHIGLSKLVNSLRPSYKNVIDMAYFQGFTQEEISKYLDMPIGTVKTNIRRALLELKKNVI